MLLYVVYVKMFINYIIVFYQFPLSFVATPIGHPPNLRCWKHVHRPDPAPRTMLEATLDAEKFSEYFDNVGYLNSVDGWMWLVSLEP